MRVAGHTDVNQASLGYTHGALEPRGQKQIRIHTDVLDLKIPTESSKRGR